MTSELEQFDLVCVGGGLGGLAAALSAQAHGLSALVLEKSSYLGGGAAYSGGLCWVPGLDETVPPDSLNAACAYLDHVQGERECDEALRLSVVRAMRDATRAYRELGVPLEVVPGNPDVYHPQAPGSTASGRMLECAVDGSSLGSWRTRLMPSPHYRIGLRHSEMFDSTRTSVLTNSLLRARQRGDVLTMGVGLAGAFVRAALAEGAASCLTEQSVTGLVTQAGRVTGVVAEGSGGPAHYGARRGVVLATGGYGWSPAAADLEGLPDFAEASPPSISGDHLVLAESVGAGLVRGSGPQFSMGAELDSSLTHPGTAEVLCQQLFDVMGLPHTLVVNRSGRRFGDESYYVGINEALRRWDAVQKRWENFPCYLVVDERFRRTYRLGSLQPGAPYPSSIARAADLRGLAAILGIDGEALTRTVEFFNFHAERGEDPSFGRGSLPFVRRRYGDPSHEPNANLGPVAEPPFYGLPLRLLGTGMCTFGLRTDEDGRVLRRDGSAVPGLHATGNAVATTEFRGYVTGYANSRNLAMAHRSVRAMSAAPVQAPAPRRSS
ncbi:MAG: FAD-dependent oxidoreductase [Mycobacteriales bacterium]